MLLVCINSYTLDPLINFEFAILAVHITLHTSTSITSTQIAFSFYVQGIHVMLMFDDF